jgi:hypothetical protein
MKHANRGKINKLNTRKHPEDLSPNSMKTNVVNDVKNVLAPIPEQNVTINSYGTAFM